MSQLRDAELRIPDKIGGFLRRTIEGAGGNEVFFLARVTWASAEGRRVATVDEVDVLARGNRVSVPALLERAEDWDLAIHNHPGGNLAPSAADTDIAAELGSRSVGFAIISNDAVRHYLVTAPFPRQQEEPIDVAEVGALFDHGGLLEQRLEGFESRRGQREMAQRIAAALNDHQVTAVEAGTGIGKSFAYLVPAILWAVKNRQRVVVCTGTIQLQEQLVMKDLPFLTKVLPMKFNFALIKGRNNYACRRKLGEVAESLKIPGLLGESGDAEQFRDLVAWAETSGDGSRADLAWSPSPDLWEQVMSETDKSLKVKCDHYQKCFYYQAKRQASAANIVVANHHLFFADLAVRRETDNYEYDLVLPAYKRVIFDEAHKLEDVASEYLGVRFSPLGIRRRLTRVCSPSDSRKGTLRQLIFRLREMRDVITAHALETSLPVAIGEALQRLEDGFGPIAAGLAEWHEGQSVGGAPATYGTGVAQVAAESSRGDRQPGAGVGARPEFQLRYRNDASEKIFWDEVASQLAAVRKELETVLTATDRSIQTLRLARIDREKRDGFLLELTSFGSRLQGLLHQVDVFCDFDDARQVRWVSGKRRGGESKLNLQFATAPIHVADDLKRFVYDPLSTVVLTSATLSVAGRVDFFSDRLGFERIEKERFRFASYASPFDFKRQALTLIPTDLPSPDARGFNDALPEAVFSLVKASRGRAFVLFTSYHLLRKTYQALAVRLREIDLLPMAQGDSQRSELLERFKACQRGVLFGTDSFWEGVDVKGRALECVVITRLPFRVPTEPVQEARAEDLQARGLHPFMNFTLPQAVLKFKQGFGRLIRSTTDRGVVAILDSRVVNKRYGRMFLNSLPETRVVSGDLQGLVSQAEEFFAAPGEKAADHQSDAEADRSR